MILAVVNSLKIPIIYLFLKEKKIIILKLFKLHKSVVWTRLPPDITSDDSVYFPVLSLPAKTLPASSNLITLN